MKKQLTILIVVMTICDFAFGQKFESNGIYYNIISATEPYQVAVTSKNTSYPYNDDDIYMNNVAIPASVTYEGNTYSVTTIMNHAFGYCNALTSVNIPKSVTTIENDAFYYCSNLIQFEVSTENPSFSAESGVLFSKNQDTLIQYPIAKSGTSYSIPNSVTTVGNAAFYSCTGLTSITIPNSVTTIKHAAFYSCINLTNITIPRSVITIENYAFVECWNLTQFEVEPENSSFSAVEGVLFSKNQDTLLIFPKGQLGAPYIIPNSVTTIGFAAFFHCTGLASLIIPNSVATIEDNAFSYCDVLAEIHVEATTPPLFSGSSAFFGVSTTIPVYVPCPSLATYQSATGWSTFSNIQCETGISEATNLPFEIYTYNNTLNIKQADGQSVAIFDMMGRCIFQTIATEETSYNLPIAGVYVVRIGKQFTKKIAIY